MATDEFGEKTELPTDHRRNEARQQGNVARSQDLNAALLMLAAALALSFFGLSILQSFARLIQASLKTVSTAEFTGNDVAARFRVLFEYSLLSVLPVIAVLAGAAILANIVQVGFMVTPEALSPKLNRINPIEGFKRLFSVRAFVRLAGSIAKFAVVIAVAALFIATVIPRLLRLSGVELNVFLTTTHDSVVGLALQLALALLALALLDFTFQKWKHEQDLRMSKQEVREEMKNMEGDPQIRQRRKDAHRKLAQAREMQQVPEADVVLRNPTHIAVALKYDPETMPAPTVVAKGMGVIAERIHRIAAEHGVPVIERKELARSLYKTVKVGQQIPGDMYEAFVEIMAYVYRLTGRTPKGL